MKNWAIDLGTTNSSIGWTDGQKTEVITFHENGGKTSIPTLVLIQDSKLKAAMTRKLSFYKDPTLKIFEEWKIEGMVSRVMGNLPFPSADGTKVKTVSPVRLSSVIIGALIRGGEEKTGEKITKITITVPANFNEEARKNTVAAAKAFRGDLDVKLAHEPTSAAVSILVDRNIEPLLNKNIVVLDIGGGTTDVSLITFKNKRGLDVDVHGTEGLDVAGKTIDSLILKKFIMPAIAKQIGISKNEYRIAMNGPLMYEAERIKLRLSREQGHIEEVIKFNFKKNKKNIFVDVEYSDLFEEIRAPFSQILYKIDEVIRKAGISKTKIDSVILAGSSSDGPWISELVNEYFGREVVSNILKPGTAIVTGASIISAVASAADENKTFSYIDTDIKLSEKTPTCTSIVTLGGCNTFMIEKNTPLPISVTETFYAEDNDSKYDIQITTSNEKNFFFQKKDITFAFVVGVTNYLKPINITISYDLSMNLSITIENDGQVTSSESIERMQKDTHSNFFKEYRESIEGIDNSVVDELLLDKFIEENGGKELFSNLPRNEISSRIKYYISNNTPE